MITIGTLVVGGLSPTVAARICDDLVKTCEEFDISTPSRQAAFVAQCLVESVGFTRTEEIMNYTTPGRIMGNFPSSVKSLAIAKSLVSNPEKLANWVYAGREGNHPDPAVGDGFRYRGRGYLQITGKTNYANASQDCGIPYVDQPELAAVLPGAWKTAASYWERNGCSGLADKGQWDAITRAINGRAMLKAEERKDHTALFFRAFA